MKKFSASSVITIGVLALASSQAAAVVKVGVFQENPWIGFMNWFERNPDNTPGAYAGGGVWGVADLASNFTNNVLTLSPNTNIDRDVPNDTPYWWQDNSGTSPSAKLMFASYYVEDNALAGQEVNFTGKVTSLTFVAPYQTYAFIKDFAPDYSSNVTTQVLLTPGMTFNLTAQTGGDGRHIQYGFETQGPAARLATVAELGNIQITKDAISGDYNRDGYVDAADYTVWADSFGQTGSGLAADGNSDSVVDAADYTIWADNFGRGTPPAGVSGAVPEPGAMALALPAVALLARRRR